MASLNSDKAPIAVIIPTYNRRWSLSRCLDSVFNQSLAPTEILLIDDGSTDATEHILTPYIDKGLRYLKQNHCGVAAARNWGVSQSTSPWIAFLDSDDEWHPDKLKTQWDFHLNHPESKISQCREIWIRKGKRVNPPRHLEKMGGDLFEMSLENCMITPSSVLIKRTLFEEFGGFDEDFLTCEDYELWLRLTAKHSVLLIENYLLTRYGGHEDQLSAKYPVMDLYRIEAQLKLLESQSLSRSQADLCHKILLQKLKIVDNGARKRENADVLAKISAFSTRFKNLV